MQTHPAVTAFRAAPLHSNGAVAEATLYSAYGLNIRSELPLPEFSRLSGRDSTRFDVTISFAPLASWIDPVRELNSSWNVNSADSRFWFRGVGGFQVLAGSEIRITPEPGIDNRLLRMYVEGMMMATLLFQRGNFVLHASVVSIGGRSAAFLGHVGAGKSSTAAALHARGHAVVTDDNAAIDLSAASPHVTPAFPYVKVFPAIAASLGVSEDSLTLMHSSQPKCVHAVSTDFPDSAVPLDCIYVLSRDAEITPRRLTNPAAVMELIRNSVPTRWKLAGGAAHLRQCAQLAATTPVFLIRTFRALPELPELAQRIETHFNKTAAA